eukprot:scaffold395699_cov19-Prasinocladus_malaysianus.AAC.1
MGMEWDKMEWNGMEYNEPIRTGPMPSGEVTIDFVIGDHSPVQYDPSLPTRTAMCKQLTCTS